MRQISFFLIFFLPAFVFSSCSHSTNPDQHADSALGVMSGEQQTDAQESLDSMKATQIQERRAALERQVAESSRPNL